MQPAALVILQDPTTSHVLLVKRKDVPIWVIPGGGIDEGEEPEGAALRELRPPQQKRLLSHFFHSTNCLIPCLLSIANGFLKLFRQKA